MDEYRLIDMERWPRAAHYRRFTEEAPCAVTMTDDVDVTDLRRACKDAGRSFYLSVLWLVSAAVNAHEEFRLTEADAPDLPAPMPAVWDVVHPAHNVFHEETETYTGTFSLFSPDPVLFAERAAEDIERAKRLTVPAIPTPPNVFDASCVPWRHFTHAGALTDAPSLSPLVVWGGFREAESRGRGTETFMPLSVTISHAAADGFHLARFLNEVEEAGRALAGSMGGARL